MYTFRINQLPFYSPLAYLKQIESMPFTQLLHSSSESNGLGRYSYLVSNPVSTFVAKDNDIMMDNKPVTGKLFDILEEWLKLQQHRYKQPDLSSLFNDGLPSFLGGMVGFFGYELFQHLEDIPKAKIDDLNIPDITLGCYDELLIFDLKHKACYFISYKSDENHSLLSTYLKVHNPENRIKPIDEFTKSICNQQDITSNLTKSEYTKAVKGNIQYILEGDIFEGTVAQRFKAPCPISPYVLFQKLSKINPAPFSAFCRFEGFSLVSASPERFLKVSGRQVEARPIKGTIKRCSDLRMDTEAKETLRQSEKDRAENIMIVDLMRNDLSKVCIADSISVPKLCEVETFQTVHHLVSVVTGTLKEHESCFSLLKACFPGGSITGAPKIRAMEIISEFEPHIRGPYCGSIGFIDFNGNMDLSITIRTFVYKDKTVYFHAGGAVTLDSNPDLEYEESLTKANALMRTLTDDITD